MIDVLATDGHGRKYLISLKWQQVAGTAEQKVPFEAICLAEAIRTGEGEYHKAYSRAWRGWLVIDGSFIWEAAWMLHLQHSNLVEFRSLESFIALANQGRL